MIVLTVLPRFLPGDMVVLCPSTFPAPFTAVRGFLKVSEGLDTELEAPSKFYVTDSTSRHKSVHAYQRALESNVGFRERSTRCSSFW